MCLIMKNTGLGGERRYFVDRVWLPVESSVYKGTYRDEGKARTGSHSRQWYKEFASRPTLSVSCKPVASGFVLMVSPFRQADIGRTREVRSVNRGHGTLAVTVQKRISPMARTGL